jgi:hypothetical protein
MSEAKKPLIIGISIIISIFIIVFLFKLKPHNEFIINNRIVLDKAKIHQIQTKSQYNPPWLNMVVTDEKQISYFVDYPSSLHFDEEQGFWDGNGLQFLVTVRLKDNTEAKFVIVSKELPYIIANICEDNQDKTGEPSIEGIVKLVDKEEISGNKFCIIEDENSVKHKILMRNPKIIFGDYRPDVYFNDQVKVFFHRPVSESVETEASTIYIHNQEK